MKIPTRIPGPTPLHRRSPIPTPLAHRKPNHADAELMLKLYDLPPRIRHARIAQDHLHPGSRSPSTTCFQIAKLGHDNAAWRQSPPTSRWPTASPKNGIDAPDFVAENNGEGLVLCQDRTLPRSLPHRHHPHAFANAEWLVRHSKYARERLALHHKRLATLRDVPLPPLLKKKPETESKPKSDPKPKTHPNNPPPQAPQPSSTS
ncbi:MAG: hypothetical protein R3F17_15480 [Planctomycetota bacterium]